MSEPLLLQPIADFYRLAAAFEALPDEALQRLASKTQIDYVGRGVQFLTQGESRLEQVYLVKEGAIALFDEPEDEGAWDILDEGRLYGGLSILRNKGVSLRSARTLEDTFFYLIPKESFIEICGEFTHVKDYFFNRLTARYRRSQEALRKRRLVVLDEDEDIFMHLSVADAAQGPVTECVPGDSVKRGAEIMTEAGTGYLLVLNEERSLVGIVTDSDLRRLIVAEERRGDQAVESVMQSPVRTIRGDATVLEALMLMLQHKLSYLPVIANGGVVGVLSASGLPQVQRQSLLTLLRRIRLAQAPETLRAVKTDLARIVRSLFQEGYAVEHISVFMTQVSDGVLVRLIQLAMEKLGPAPCPFAFITMGSEGRSEQTLLVDQDNGLILPDEVSPNEINYFKNLSAMVCTWLDDAGYCYCNGHIMANNPDWRLSLNDWKSHFGGWISEPEPKAVMHGQIFFDFRVVFGDARLGEALRDYLLDRCSQRADLFFYHLAAQQADYTPPIGFFRNFIVVSKGEHKETFDIKKAMNAVVGFARIFSLAHGLRETNTLQRLIALRDEGVLTEPEFEEIKRGYLYMMSLRLHHQEEAIASGDQPDNFVNPHHLSNLDQEILKAVFRMLTRLQVKTRQRFQGPAIR